MYQSCPGLENAQAQNRLDEFQSKKNIELQSEIIKSKISNDSKMDLEQRKMYLQEFKRQSKIASYSAISIGESGMIEIKEKNAILDLPARPIVNFTFDIIANLISSDGEKGFYCLGVAIDGAPVQIFLNAQKVGKPEYFIKKITAKGGKIFADSETRRKNVALGLWTELCKHCKDTLVIPCRVGWIRDPEKRYKFVEKGTVLWREVCERAK